MAIHVWRGDWNNGGGVEQTLTYQVAHDGREFSVTYVLQADDDAPSVSGQ